MVIPVETHPVTGLSSGYLKARSVKYNQTPIVLIGGWLTAYI